MGKGIILASIDRGENKTFDALSSNVSRFTVSLETEFRVFVVRDISKGLDL